MPFLFLQDCQKEIEPGFINSLFCSERFLGTPERPVIAVFIGFYNGFYGTVRNIAIAFFQQKHSSQCP